MKRLSTHKSTNLSRNQRKIIVISILILIILAIIISITNFIKSLTKPIENVSSETINIQFSTREVICEDVILTLSTTTKYDIYYYIDFKNQETADESILTIENNENIEKLENIEDNINTNTSYKLKNVDNSLYKKYENNIIVENNAVIYLKYAHKNKLSNAAYSFEVNNIDKQGPNIGEIKVSSTSSSITLTIDATDNFNPNFTYYFRLAEDKEFVCTENINTYTFTNLEKNETYTIYVKVADGFGNESEAVTDATSSTIEIPIERQKYYIKVNLAANTVTIYGQDENEEYTKPIKAMICSVGKATPKSGKYNITYKYRCLALFGNVYGQYSTRIVGSILFHSVPYYTTDPNTLKYEEFDKLGTKASAGCIRLMVKDAKWIYDNVASGSTVEFYSDAENPGPLGKPTAPKISNNEYRDWDPTDPDPRNPWLGGDGKVISTHTGNNSNNSTNEINNETANTVNNEISNSTNDIWDENKIPWGTED